MVHIAIKKLELNEFYGEHDRNQHCRATFPLLGAHGAKDCATVYFEIEPGEQLGRHTDSAEEILFIVDGKVEVEIDGETEMAEAGSLTLVPEMLPHNVFNKGNETARVIGFFGGANNIVTTFEQVLVPIQTRVVDTAKLGQA